MLFLRGAPYADSAASVKNDFVRNPVHFKAITSYGTSPQTFLRHAAAKKISPPLWTRTLAALFSHYKNDTVLTGVSL